MKLVKQRNGSKGQITNGLVGLSNEQVASMVIAYEPIWAIGTGKSADANIADEICGVVRSTVEKLYGKEVSEAVRIQYGGSVKPETSLNIWQKENVDGAFSRRRKLRSRLIPSFIRCCKIRNH